MADGWEGILDKDEQIIWQGHPVGGIKFKPRYVFPFIFGLFFAGFALFWMVMASRAGGGFWMFGLIHFTVGIGMAFGTFMWPAIMAKRTWYTLTDQRAIIAKKSIFGNRSLKSYPITAETPIEFQPGETDSINFATETRRGNKGRTYQVDVGFQDIDDGAGVHRMIRDIQKGDQ